MILDRLPSGTLDDFHRFRESAYDFLYLCKTCHRSFDSAEEMDSCKFCGSRIIQLRRTMRGKKPATYTYYCTTCEKSFTAVEKITVCSNCRTDYLHVYTWDMLRRRDKFYIKVKKSLSDLFSQKNFYANRRVHTGGITFRPVFSRNGEEMPSR